jgi:CRP/FNR family transcriptional regulator
MLDEAKLALSCSPGQVLFVEGDPCRGIYCIQSGVVALRKAGHGETNSVVALRHSGDTLGYRAFAADSPYRNSAEATTECQLCYVDRSVLKGILEANPAVANHFLCLAASETDQLETLVVTCRSLPVRARLANVLLVLKDRYASADEEGNLRFELPLSRGVLASLIGARPESLSRAINALGQDGVAQFRGREVLVSDLDDLLDEIEGVSPGG